MAQPKRKDITPAAGHNNPPEILPAIDNVSFDGHTLNMNDKSAVKEFIHGAVRLWRQGNRAIHLAAAVAVFHAQQYGDPSMMNDLHGQFDETSEKALRSGLRSWFGGVATVEGEVTKQEDGSEVTAPDRVWLTFSMKEGFKVKPKSQDYRKDNMTLQEIIDLPPFFAKAHGEEKTFDFVSFLKFLKGLENKAEGQAEKSNVAIPAAYLKPLQMLAAMAEQDLAAVTTGGAKVVEILAQRNK